MRHQGALILSICVVLGSPSLGCPAEPQEPSSSAPKGTGFESPHEAWKTWEEASNQGDWGRAYDCLTPAARDEATFDCIAGIMMGIGWFDLREADDKEIQALVQQCDTRLSAHGINPKQIEEELEKLEKEAMEAKGAGLDQASGVQFILRLIKDRRRCFVETMPLKVKLQETMEKKFADNGLVETEDEPVSAGGTDVDTPPFLDILVKVKIRGNYATGRITRRLPDTTVLEVGGKRIRFTTETKYFRQIGGLWYVASVTGEPFEAPTHKIPEAGIPYEKSLTMEAGDALSFELPNGKSVAVWCDGGGKSLFAAEQTTSSGLKTSWGEKPFKHVDYKRERQPDGSAVLGDADSYIEQGPVITKSDRTSTYRLFIDEWQFDIVEDLQAKEALPVTIRVVKRTDP